MDAAGRRVGLLGGSFNPAHEGHLHISLLALARLGLDEVWWLVSPRNPLKSSAELAPFAARLAAARALVRRPDIVVSDIEARLGTRYSADTLAALKTCFPRTRFVWLMGADNLAQLPRWKNWQRIFRLVPVAIFDRAPYSFGALAGKAAVAFDRYKLRTKDAPSLVDRTPPAWIFFHSRLHPASASAIRARAARRARAAAGQLRNQPRRAR